MTTKFIVDHPTVRVIDLNSDQLLNKLEPQVYTVDFNPITGFSLTINKEELKLPNKIYGNAHKRTKKCLHTYRDRTTSTGILLTGDKGTGKTLQMALLANAAITDLKLPVILVRDPYAGTQFTAFVESLGECCLVFDEFGKMYANKKKSNDDDNVTQNALLTLMDGVDKTKRLLILTENNTWDINDFMLNRPSRIYYHFEYSKLPENSITDYCNDKNVSTDITKDIIDLSRKSEIFSFDILQSIVEEHLRFGSSVKDVIEDLNVDVKAKDRKIQITKVIDKHTNEELKIHGPSIVSFNGYDFGFRIEQPIEEVKERLKAVGDDTHIPPTLLKQANTSGIYMEEGHLAYQSNNTRVYENDHYTVVTKEIITQQSNYSQFV